MTYVAAMVTNRPEKARQALDAYRVNEDLQPSEWLLVTPARHKKAMQNVGRDVHATVVVEEEFRDALPSALRAPFGVSFGGFRNMALAFAAKEKKSVVFVDDDTRPQNDVFRRHAGLLQDAGLVIGKYAGHVGGASTTLLDLTHELEKFEDGRMAKDEFNDVLALRLQGVPPMQKPVEHAGAVGGNLGIHGQTARLQAFATLPYRVEDGTYAALCQGKVVNPSVARSPIVLHEKQGRSNGLVDELDGDWKGNVLAGGIVAEARGEKTTRDERVKQVRKGLLMDYFTEKYGKMAFRHTELDHIRDLNLTVSEAEMQAAIRAYRDVQEVWQSSWEAVG